jgi:hypothetical protein
LTAVTRYETRALGDAGLREVHEGDIVQLARRGFFRCDQPFLRSGKPVVLFAVPDGHAKAGSALSTKVCIDPPPPACLCLGLCLSRHTLQAPAAHTLSESVLARQVKMREASAAAAAAAPAPAPHK